MIFALATPVAQSAIGVFRVSGAGCCDVFNGALNKPISRHREVFLRDVFWNGVLVDRCSVVFYSGPNSYTGEDSIEVFCHGGLSVIKSLTGVFLELGFREAGPGEFSKIAFENGKLSLNEAEAVADLIHSEDVERSLLSSEAVAGKLSSIISDLGNEVDELRVFVEGSIDFSDEDYARVGAPSDDEMDMLELAFGLTATSRLGCQIMIDESLDGLTVKVPKDY